MSTKLHNIDIVGYDSGWGCADYGCEDGPDAVNADHILAVLTRAGLQAAWQGSLGLRTLGDHAALKDKLSTLPLVTTALTRLSLATAASVEAGNLPVVLGGDHSCAIGTWSGITSALETTGKFGLIWIDAHMDCHTDQTAHEGKWGGWWHGQPVPALCGYGLEAFTNLSAVGAKLSPQHISIIGPHSFEPAEEAFVAKHDIRVYKLDEVKARGFAPVFAEAMTRATTGTNGFGMTIDLDAFCAADAPGVGTAEDDGLTAAEVLPIIRGVGRQTGFSGLEIVEFNPHKDIDGKTAQLIEKLIENIFTNPA